MGTLVCTITLDKEKGACVEILNEEGKITQTIEMDGTTLTITVKGEQETSTIIQKDASIAIKCKTFTLDAETITCTSTKASLHESKDTFTIKSTKDMTLESQAKLVESAVNDASLKAMNVKIDAQ